MDKAESWLYNALQYRFDDRSANSRHNERLEFLGDAVLDFVISAAIFEARPDAPEGDLSKLRSSLVKDTTLAAIAGDLGMGPHLVLGDGERKTGGHRRKSILADALEAIFGAVFLDRGVDAARAIILRVYRERLADLPDVAELRDPKTRLQEWLQARGLSLPEYDLVDVTGKDHKQRFSVTCTVAEFGLVTHGESTTRRKAEQRAARSMLKRLLEQEQ